MRTAVHPLLGATLLLTLTAGCADHPTPAEPAASSQTVAPASLPDPVFSLEWGFDGKSLTPTSATMNDVFAVAPGEVWAVGEGGNVRRYTGGTFVNGPSVPGSTSTSAIILRGVWGSSAGNVVAVGVRSSSTGPRGRLFHYDGGAWTEEQVTAEALNEVWGVSPTEAYAVGSEIVRWDGTSSTRVYGPTGVTFMGVWGSGPDDIFAVGTGGTIVHYDGVSWQVQPTPTGNPLNGVWGFGPDDVYAVGSGGAILHYDGASWTAMTGGGGHTLNEVWGPHPDTVLAVGFNPGSRRAVLVRLDGTAWTSDPEYAATRDRSSVLSAITSISGFSADEYFIGSQGTASVKFWRVAGGADRRYALHAVWGFTRGPVFAVGDSGFVLRRTGGRWHRLAPGTSAHLSAAWGSSPTDLHVAGYNNRLQVGVMLRFDGTTFHPVPLPGGGSRIFVSAIWGSRDTLWAAADLENKILYRPGQSAAWVLVPTSPEMQYPLTDIHGRSTHNIFATDVFGGVWRYDGQSWNGTLNTDDAGDAAVWHDGTAVWVVQRHGLYRRGTDGTWSLVSPLSTENALGVWGTATDDVFIVVSTGEVLRWDGTSLRALPASEASALSAVWTAAGRPSDVWAVGGSKIVHGRR